MKIVVADTLPASALELLRSDGWTVDARSGRPPDVLAGDLSDADALLVRSATKVDASLMAAAPRLRIIARAGTGVDNVDVEAASARGILVVNAAGANSISVAEHAWALMLALARAIPSADRAMKDGRWEKKAFLGTELRGKTLGVAGFGRIGQEVAQRARAFGMHVIAHDPFISADLAGRFGVELVSIDELCAASDYLTLHLPATADTHHLFNDERFARCKPGVRLINTARGELVDEHALGRAIEKGIVAGAGLDVFENEPLTDWGLARLPQVIATPHIAASTEEAQEMVGHETAVTVRDFLRDGVVRNAVNFPSVHPEELQRLQPWIRLVDLLGAMASQMGVARIEAISLRYYGALAESHATGLLASSAAVGVLRPILSDNEVSIVNARSVARGALGRRHGVRPEQPAAGLGAGRHGGSAAVGDHPDDRQRRSAGRDRRGRHDSGPARREHRQLCPGAKRRRRHRRGERGRRSRQSPGAGRRAGRHPKSLRRPRGLGHPALTQT
jgi:D-3-phosphoglycerate dehydrogenase